MRERIERFSIRPFSMSGCVSQSSIEVIENEPNKSETEANPPPPRREVLSSEKMKNSLVLPPLPKPNISAGLQRVIKSFKNLSHLFQVYREQEDDEMEIEMEIGFPTDVQHVGHIGWDGSDSVSTMKSWDRAPEFLDLPCLSLSQFELVMAREEDDASPTSGHLRFA